MKNWVELESTLEQQLDLKRRRTLWSTGGVYLPIDEAYRLILRGRLFKNRPSRINLEFQYKNGGSPKKDTMPIPIEAIDASVSEEMCTPEYIDAQFGDHHRVTPGFNGTTLNLQLGYKKGFPKEELFGEVLNILTLYDSHFRTTTS